MTRVELLKDMTHKLALPPRDQVEYVRSLGPNCGTDELALDFNAIAAAAGSMLEDGELTRKLADGASSLDELLSAMSGAHNAHLWTLEALATTTEWAKVRALANAWLRLFDETYGSA